MKKFRGIPVWAVVLILLLLANLGWMSWNVHQYADRIVAAKLFRVKLLNTNDVSGVVFYEVKTKQPIWSRFRQEGGKVTETSFYQGKEVFEIFVRSNRPPKYGVYFRGDGNSAMWWVDRGGSGSFTERVTYDTEGVPRRHEVWYDDAWHRVERRDEMNGVIMNGEWRRLRLGTNGVWTIETPVRE